MEQAAEEFFHDFRQQMLAEAEASQDFQLMSFMTLMTDELREAGVIEDFSPCHYRTRGIRTDGYWFDDEGVLSLFVADFEFRTELASLTRTDVETAFRRLQGFLEASLSGKLHSELDITTPEYDIARQIADRSASIRRVECFLLSERALSDRLQGLDDLEVNVIPVIRQIWDITRLQRQQSSRGHKEALEIDFPAAFGTSLSCLPAHSGSDFYKSYLVVVPGTVLADLYGRYGARLLERNVRSFLQARAKVNKGIRTTILTEPDMFFAYNNGLTATAESVATRSTDDGLVIDGIKDLQIVNGGQTTASLFHTRRNDKASLDSVFVQMKLTVIDDEKSEEVVPRISEYANTQNKVNAADFFSNHPFHVQMESYSRRIWAPAQKGAQRETKWFYERARGQFADAQSKFTPAQKKKFLAESPKSQMFTKTDLAKFDNVWDEHPRWVNLGAQKNFARYAFRIGKIWDKSPDTFNEMYFRRVVARAIIFRKTEKLVSDQPWYNGGYRANIVAYAIASLGECCKRVDRALDFETIWHEQAVPPYLEHALVIAGKFVNDFVSEPPAGISNVSEWCKKEACWTRIKDSIGQLEKMLPESFSENLRTAEEQRNEVREGRKVKKIDNGIEAQIAVLKVSARTWNDILDEGSRRKLFSEKEVGVLRVAAQMPAKTPTEKQSFVLMEVLEKAEAEGIAGN